MSDTQDHKRPEGEKEYWLDKSANVTKVYWAVVIVCAILIALDFFYHKHAELEMEHLWGFYGWYGFISCVFLVLAAKEIRKLLMRDEDYYDR